MVSQENGRLSHAPPMVGRSRAMAKVFKLIETVAPTEATVLIVGKTGTGKELVARALHRASARNKQPFVAVNCSAIASDLWESEMFGHEKGAFTGAISTKKGRFELADGGTLFLDEISEMSLLLQSKSLRVFQEMEFERVGGAKTIKVDVRLVAATNKDLAEGVKEGWFREDLFYRINVIKIQLLRLRDHREDIPSLVAHFTEKHAVKTGKAIEGITDEALQILMDYPFPGNVRELQNIIQRAVILAHGNQLAVRDLPEEVVCREGPNPRNRVFPEIKDKELSQALQRATVYNNGGPPRLWRHTLRSVTTESIHGFLSMKNSRPFSRIEFAEFLRQAAKSNRNKYGTAGRYLSILKKNNICVHNKGKANQSRYRLSEVFLA